MNYCNSLYCHTSKEILCVREDVISYTTEEIKKEIIKISEERESGKEMSTIQERIGAEFRRNKRIARSEGRAEGLAEGLAEGRAEGLAKGLAQAIKQIIERMINMNLEDEFIGQATGAKKEEIQKIRKEVQK